MWHRLIVYYHSVGKVPKDSLNIVLEEQRTPPGVYITACVFASSGIVLAVSLFAFNIVFRENRLEQA